MNTFTLYGTSACHLCELAQALLASQQVVIGGFEVVEVDIIASEALCERYGMRIPVLQHPDNRELNWPFDAQQLRIFLAL